MLPTPAAGEVVVRALYSGISRGTEALVFGGRVPPSEWERMRAPFQPGRIPGAGEVRLRDRRPGRARPRRALDRPHVFVLHPHQTRFIVPAAAVHLLPDGITSPGARCWPQISRRRSTACGMPAARWRPYRGDRRRDRRLPGRLAPVAYSRMRRRAGRHQSPPRGGRQRARVPFAEPPAASGDADLVIHASGAPEGLELALQVAGVEATIVELSWFGDRTVPLPLGGAFHAQAPDDRVLAGRPRRPVTAAAMGHRRRMQLALTLLRDPRLDVLITGESEFEALPEVMATLARSPGDTLCHRIRYS